VANPDACTAAAAEGVDDTSRNHEEAPVSTVVFDTSMSLDGYMTAAGRTPEEPMGPGGLQLVAWTSDTAYLERNVERLGAVIAGRITYDTSMPWWGPDGPSGSARRPVFVVTHEEPDDRPEGGVYRFVTDGIESALQQAREAAGDKIVTVMGGADLGRQYLAAGLVDELSIHVAPVLFGSGTPMFQPLDLGHVQLELLETVGSPLAIHLRYRIVKEG
jgi:dihydrofolate reductase